MTIVSQDKLRELGISFVRSKKGVAEYRLDANGLRILLVENHVAPVVTTLIVYRVGSRNEAVGTTGSTHFLEHMMFKSTPRFDHAKGHGIDDVLKPVGADYNATTGDDRTCYYASVPRRHLALCLALEADRMRNLHLKEDDRRSEMTVVRSEFEIGENDPAEILQKELHALAFREHPYHHPTIGWRSDVEGVPLEKLQAFYDTFYWPNNATMIVAGDFEPDEALKLVSDEFSAIPPSPHAIPSVYTTEPEQEGERRFVVRRSGEDLPRVTIGWHRPEATHADFFPLAVLSHILGGDHLRSSRLYKAVIDAEIASEVGASCDETRDPGLFTVDAMAAPGVEPHELERVIRTEVARVTSELVSDQELARAREANHNGTVIWQDDQQAYVQELCEGEAVGDWTWLVDYDEHFEAVTAQDILRVAQKYLTDENITVGHYVPRGEEDAGRNGAATTNGDGAGEPAESATEDAGSRAVAGPADRQDFADGPDDSAHTPGQTVPDGEIKLAERIKRIKLDNGLTLLVVPAPGTGVVSISGKVRAGRYFADKDKRDVAQLVAQLLPTGTRRFSKDEIADRLERLSIHLEFEAGNFASNFATTFAASGMDTFVELLGSMLTEPLLAEDEVKKEKQQLVAQLQADSSDTHAIAYTRLMKTLYKPGDVYYKKAFSGQIKDVKALEHGDVTAFHAAHYTPGNTTIAIVGDVEADAVAALFQKHLGAWSGGTSETIEVPGVKAQDAARRIDVPMADKANVDIIIGSPTALTRTAADYVAASLGNAALGADTISSRLGAEVREKNGLTYGIYSRFADATFGQAAWMIQLSVNPDNADKALALVNQVLERYRHEGITDKELADEAGRTYGLFVVGLRSTRGIADTLLSFEFAGLKAEAVDEFATQLRSVTREQVNEAIRKYLRTDLAVTVLAGTRS